MRLVTSQASIFTTILPSYKSAILDLSILSKTNYTVRFPVIYPVTKIYPVSLSICKEDKFLWISIKTGFAFATKSLGWGKFNCPYQKTAILWRHFFDWHENAALSVEFQIPIWQRNCLLGQSEFTFFLNFSSWIIIVSLRSEWPHRSAGSPGWFLQPR